MGSLLIKRGDTRKGLRAILKTDGAPVSLEEAGIKVKFYMAQIGKPAKVNKEVHIENAAAGEVWVIWTAENVDKAGEYRAEFEVVHADGRKETFPDTDYFAIKIIEDLG